MPNLMTKKNLLYLSFLGCLACGHAPRVGDRKLGPGEVPGFLNKYRSFDDVEFYEKGSDKKKSYEVKYEEHDEEVSLAFDKSGKFLEREEDVDFDDLPQPLQKKIRAYLRKEYPGHRILEVEKREEADAGNFIDVEIRHESSESGYWEITFSPEGEYVSREIEDYQQLETLN